MPRFDRQLARDFLDGDRLLTTDEVAGLLRVDSKTVARWAAADRFPDTPTGKPAVIRAMGRRSHVRIRESVVRGLIDGTLKPREADDDGAPE
jgi:hypothetical protein